MTMAYENYTTAQRLFGAHKYTQAAASLEQLLAGDQPIHATTEARLLLARSYYHSAQLRRAEETVRDLLIDTPHEPYAQLLLGRILQRTGRRDAAKGHLRMAKLLGDYEV